MGIQKSVGPKASECAMVAMRSSSYSSTTSTGSVPSGTPVTYTLAIINPKSFDVAYSLGWNVDNSLFMILPSTSPTASDAPHLFFSFALAPKKAERKTVTFSLGKYVASINKMHISGFSSTTWGSPDPIITVILTLYISGPQRLTSERRR